MISFLQYMVNGELDIILRLFNSAGILAALGYAISIERRLSRLEGKLSSLFHSLFGDKT